MPQETSVGPVGVTVGMKQIRYFLHILFDKCIFVAQYLIFEAIGVFTALENPKDRAWQEWPHEHCCFLGFLHHWTKAQGQQPLFGGLHWLSWGQKCQLQCKI